MILDSSQQSFLIKNLVFCLQMFIDEVMDLVELLPLKDALVGLPGVSGLSTEQRKRLTIAVELVANPSIIFMDEPTSGLDARAAAIVMRAIRNTVDTGRTVVCTIHQPSIDIFESFDEVNRTIVTIVLLSRIMMDINTLVV
jgi:ABC-type multidrug transport system ATPase subunit